MLQRLPIALAQVKASITSENLLNKIRQIIYSLHQEIKLSKNYIARKWNQQSHKTEWILYLRILKIVKHSIIIDY